MPDLTGATLGKYQIVGLLGKGGMAEVYKAFHPNLERHVAIKLLQSSADTPDFAARFKREATAVARLRHPHIVQVYDFDSDADRAFMVMELVEGGTLKDRLAKLREQKQRLVPPEVRRIFAQLAEAVAYAHAHGIIHRDLKPANVMFDASGNVLLADFGIAVIAGSARSTATDAVLGTPAYMSPEQCKGERGDERSDIYALGVILYEMTTGDVPFDADTPVGVIMKHLTEPLPPPSTISPDVPDDIETAIATALSKDPSERYQVVGEMLAALSAGEAITVAARTPADEPPAPGESPYKGLQYFDENDADLFFGRETLVAKLVGQLREHRFLAVIVGASGSGKSSIVRAGLVPALKRGEPLADGTLPPEGSQHWQAYIITPSSHPLESLAASLTRKSESVIATATLIDDLKTDSRSLHLFSRKKVGNNNRVLLVVDQFEELFTLCHDEPERKAFIDNLMTATSPDTNGPTTVAITLRADFYAHCAQYADLREVIAKRQEYIGPMSANELRRAIEEPARQSGWQLEPGLVDTLLKDVSDEPGALPLLSHALLETWKRRRGHMLTLQGYAESGAVRGAIARTADRVYAQFTPEEQVIARRIFLRLTELGEGTQDTRRRATLGELVPNLQLHRHVESVLKVLTDARLIITDDQSVEVAHEALIREWPALREWLNENRESLRLHRQLARDAREWERLNRDAGALYRGARLARALEWAVDHSDETNGLEYEFLKVSKHVVEHEEREREAQREKEVENERHVARQLRARNSVISFVGAMALLLAIVALFFAHRSNENSRTALSRQLAAQSLALIEQQIDLAWLLGIESYHLNKTAVESRQSLLLGLAHDYSPTFLRGHTAYTMAVAFSPDGNVLIVGSWNDAIILLDISDPQAAIQLDMVPAHHNGLLNIALSPDGHTLASAGMSKAVILWDISNLRSVKQIGVLPGHAESVRSVAFSSDGRMLATGSEDGTIIVWDVSDPRYAKFMNVLTAGGIVYSVAFNSDGRTLASANGNGAVSLWEVDDSGQVALINRLAHPNIIYTIAFSPDGKTLASGGEDDTVTLWDVSDPQSVAQLHILQGHQDFVKGLAFSPDGDTLASASGDNTIILWDVSYPAFATQLRVLAGHKTYIRDIAFSPNGQALVGAGDDDALIVWDVGDPQSAIKHDVLTDKRYYVTSIAIDPDRKTLVTGDNAGVIALWNIGDPLSLKLRSTLSGHKGPVPNIALSPNGMLLASTEADGTIALWDVSNPQSVDQIGALVAEGGVGSIAISPDGRILASSGNSNTIVLWNISSPQSVTQVGTLMEHASRVNSLAFNPSSGILASGSEDGTILLWDVNTLELIGQVEIPSWGNVLSLAFNPDGKTLASGSNDNTIVLWDITNPKSAIRQSVLIGHKDNVLSLAFSLDGKMLASGSDDNRIILWDVNNLKLAVKLGALAGHWGSVTSILFGLDGNTMISGSHDGTVIFWDVDADSWSAKLCQRVGRNLTHEEWKQHLGDKPYRKTCEQWPEGK